MTIAAAVVEEVMAEVTRAGLMDSVLCDKNFRRTISWSSLPQTVDTR